MDNDPAMMAAQHVLSWIGLIGGLTLAAIAVVLSLYGAYRLWRYE